MGLYTSDVLPFIADDVLDPMETFSHCLVEDLFLVVVRKQRHQFLLAQSSETRESLFLLLEKLVNRLFEVFNQLNCVLERLIDFGLQQLQNVRLLFDLRGDVFPILLQDFELLVFVDCFVSHRRLHEHFVHLNDLLFYHFPNLNEFIHFIKGEISPVHDVFFEELDESA